MNMKSLFSNGIGPLVLVLLVTINGFSTVLTENDLDPDDALILTPYIQAGQLEQAKNLSMVGPIAGMIGITSYSGYLTVNSKYNSNLFFWYFLATNNHETAPVLLWLQGGPGSSDMFGLFVEIGPYSVDAELQLHENVYTWIDNFNVIFIDNPVGTGFSFTDADEGYASNEDDVSRDLDNALRQFFTLFPEYVNNEFYLTGESYAGKYIPALGYKIHLNNPGSNIKINLKGLAIGNGFVDPLSQTNYGDYLYGLGLIDQNQLMTFLKLETWIETYINMGEFGEAAGILDAMIAGGLYPYATYFTNYTGLKSVFNFLETEVPANYYEVYVDQPEVRQAIHVGSQPFHNGSLVGMYLGDDQMNTTKPWLESLLDNDYRVMLYNGQLDIIVAYALTMDLVDSMIWNTMDDYHSASRLIWKVDILDEEVAGYVRPSHNFVEVLVRNAGHMVPMDQPRAALDLITRFIQGKPWTN